VAGVRGGQVLAADAEVVVEILARAYVGDVASLLSIADAIATDSNLMRRGDNEGPIYGRAQSMCSLSSTPRHSAAR